MERLKIVKRIPDLQIEWATQYANQSLRAFLIETKCFTERQYRYVLDKAPALDWNIRKEEVQNKVASEKVESFAKQAATVHRGFVAAAELATVVAHRALSKSGSELKSSDLLNLLKSLSEAQEIYLKAMGVPKGSGILDLYSETLRSTQVKEQVPKPQSRDFDMSYDDIMVLIEVKREMKNKMRERSP